MKEKYIIRIYNTDWDERGNFNVWRVHLEKDGVEQFLGYETMPDGTPEEALARATKFLPSKKKVE